ncbi:Atu4866 domain-containing protein [Massilia sp. DD77]|uniref:Atu4866 domain-containing protein n=1 Tax=Massilia sp. DD77 TaxID=3109349 RepID=UPI003000018E
MRTAAAAASVTRKDSATHPYAGMWVTADGYIRHELLPGGRYDEARGKRRSAYQGRYWIQGDHIEYLDDTGFTADGDFRDGVLYHAGMVLYRESAPAATGR